MSSFEYYEFYAIDRNLTEKERSEISNWSSRTIAGQRRAVFTYSYGSFPKDEEKVLLKYFDVFLYRASWTTDRLVFKFPKELVDYKSIKRFEVDSGDEFGSGIGVRKQGKYVLVDMFFSWEHTSWLEETQHWMDELVPIRSAILAKDYRSLFIMWLFVAQIKYEFNQIDSKFTIPHDLIPPRLDKLEAPLVSLMELFEVKMEWIEAAATFHIPASENDVDFAQLIPTLPEEKKDQFLIRLLENEINLAIKLKQELTQKVAKKQPKKTSSITLEELLIVVEKNAKREYMAKMKKIAANLAETKRRVLSNIKAGNAGSYNKAFEDICKIRELAIFQENTEEFERYLRKVRKACERRPAMLRRLASLMQQE